MKRAAGRRAPKAKVKEWVEKARTGCTVSEERQKVKGDGCKMKS